MMDSMKDMTTKFGKLDKFEGSDFRRWQKKMHFLYTTLKVVYVLRTPAPEYVENEALDQTRKRCKWDNDDYICRGNILNDMSDALFDVYQKLKSAKEMVDSRSVMKQYHELLRILGQCTQHEETLRKVESWKGKGKEIAGSSSVNMVEDDKNKTNNKNSKGNKRKLHDKNNDSNKKSKMAKNLMSGPVLNKCGYKQVYESDNINSVYMAYSHVVDSKLWHARLGHVHYQRLHDMSKDSLIPSYDNNMEKCNPCMLTKITRQPFKDIKKNFVLLELIHSDLFDFHATLSIGNKKYVVTYIDGASRFCYVYLLHAKDEALDKSKIYKTKVELQQNSLIKTLRTDIGGKYYDPSYFQSVGIIHQTAAPYTPQQNGVSERKNKALKEMVVVRLLEPKKKNLGEKGIDCIFIGYVEHSKAYRFYVIEPNDFIFVNSVIESRDSIFDENRFSSIPRPKDIISSSNGTQGGDLSSETPIEIPKPQRIDDEIGSIMENSTWVLSDLPPGCKPLGCKWIFKKKMKVDDKCVYCKFDESGKGVIICLYVDDMLIFGTDQNQVDKTKEFLSSNFSMKDMGEADVILGIRIMRENKGLTITQSHYIEKILKKFNYEGCDPVSTPMKACIELMPHMGKHVNQLEYSWAIVCLMYAMTSTRPNIVYAVEKLSRFTSNPSYSDASWITNGEDYTSTTGWVFFLGGGVISRAFKKQTCITDSTMESEFVALAAAGNEAEWLMNLIYEIPLWPKPISPISMHCDSAAILAKAYSQIYNGKSKHLGVRHSMVRELIMYGAIFVDFVRSRQNLADHLTKGLARDLVHKSAIDMGLNSV
uniref:Zinc finger, CCHC-type n=1 Tax=Tanacetum cinerariifolium TaxID=118510 RepID=A0A6L2KIT1_TANCI|nr:zinc finger, CCHC-type [Tanacetum cinerariifolium]